jgi:P27 family predicted phage terminase small subunit
MGKRGPKPKLAAIEKLEGNPTKKPIRPPVVVAKGVPFVPDYLSDDAKACAEGIIRSMPDGVYSAADSGLIADYAVAWSLKKSALAELEREGLIVEGSTGQLRQNPCISIIADMMRLNMAQGDRLGLDPKARQALQVQLEEKPASKFDGLIEQTGSSHSSKH